MAQLTPDIQTFIVAEFASAKPVRLILKSVKKEFNLDLDRQQIWHYHPDNPKLSPNWRKLYEDFRTRLMTDALTSVGAFKSFRLNELVDLYWTAKDSGNSVHAQDLLKQMAQEVGGLFTNTRHLNVNPREALAAMLGCEPDELPERVGK